MTLFISFWSLILAIIGAILGLLSVVFLFGIPFIIKDVRPSLVDFVSFVGLAACAFVISFLCFHLSETLKCSLL